VVSAVPEITLLKVEEAARLLRLSAASVYRRVETGELRAVRLGSGPCAPVRIEAEELERYLHGGALTRARPSTTEHKSR